MCVAARNDGKVLVTELWIDDSLDLGEMADADRVSFGTQVYLLLYDVGFFYDLAG